MKTFIRQLFALAVLLPANATPAGAAQSPCYVDVAYSAQAGLNAPNSDYPPLPWVWTSPRRMGDISRLVAELFPRGGTSREFTGAAPVSTSAFPLRSARGAAITYIYIATSLGCGANLDVADERIEWVSTVGDGVIRYGYPDLPYRDVSVFAVTPSADFATPPLFRWSWAPRYGGAITVHN